MRLVDAEQEAKWANENLPDAHAEVITQFLRECGTINPETLCVVPPPRKLTEKKILEVANLNAKIGCTINDAVDALIDNALRATEDALRKGRK